MSLSRIILKSRPGRIITTRRYLSTPPPPPPPKTPSPHAGFYTTLLPSMIPIALLGSAIYLGLEMWRNGLAHEKAMWEAGERVKEIEANIAMQLEMQREQDQGREREMESSKKPRWKMW